MPLYDFRCTQCDHEEEIICRAGEDTQECSECGAPSKKFWKQGPRTLTEIVPSHPGCKAHKAGYVHEYKRSATRVQSGPGGCVNPK